MPHARSGRKPSSKLDRYFEELATAVSAGSGWIVSSDMVSGPVEDLPAGTGLKTLLIFDGGAIGNPGKGYGSFTYTGKVFRPPTRIDFPGRTTNNQAEYQSLIGGLRALLFDSRALAIPPDSLRLDIRSDSELVVKQISGDWKIKNQILRELHGQARELLDAFANWEIRWHPRSESVRILGH